MIKYNKKTKNAVKIHFTNNYKKLWIQMTIMNLSNNR
jgi:hypothetical protein